MPSDNELSYPGGMSAAEWRVFQEQANEAATLLRELIATLGGRAGRVQLTDEQRQSSAGQWLVRIGQELEGPFAASINVLLMGDSGQRVRYDAQNGVVEVTDGQEAIRSDDHGPEADGH